MKYVSHRPSSQPESKCHEPVLTRTIHRAPQGERCWWRALPGVAGLAALLAGQTLDAQVPFSSGLSLESNTVVLKWNAEPGSYYNVLTTPSLDGPWTELTPDPLLSPLNQVILREPAAAQNRFYQVAQVDAVAPAVWGPSPTDRGVAVSRRATIEVPIYDDGMLDTNSISFTLTNGPPLHLDDPRLSFSGGLLVFTPGPGEVLGDYGQVVSVSISIADIFGNTLNNFAWSFQLEPLPIVRPNVTAVTNAPGGLVLLSTNAAGDTFVYRFSGESSGLTPGAILVSAEPDFVYRRTILTVNEDLPNHTVTVMTAEASLADCFQQSSVQFTGDLSAGDLRLASAPGARFAPAGAGSCCSLVFDGTNVISSADFVAEIIRGRFDAKPQLNLRGQFGSQGLQSADFEMRQTLVLDLSFRAQATAAGAYTNRVVLGSSQQRLPIDLVGFVPAWADANVEFVLGFEGLWQRPGAVTAGVTSTNRFAVASQFRTGIWSNTVHRILRYDVVTPSWETNLDAEARVYLEVKVTLNLDGFAGPQWLTRPALNAVGSTYAPSGYAGSDVFLYDEFAAMTGLDVRSWDADVSPTTVRLSDAHDLIYHRTETVPVRIPAGALIKPLANMVWIPAGEFHMGRAATPAPPAICDCPLTRVALSNGFFMGRFEVMQSEYLALTTTNPSVHHGGNWGTNLSRPVENISWRDATNHCRLLTTRERQAGRIPYNYVYRLPTEAEWEYACRSGTTNHYYYGEVLATGMANFDCRLSAMDPCTNNPVLTVIAPSTSPDPQSVSVGRFSPNAWGLHDMHGNVREWCLDWLGDTLPGGELLDPMGPMISGERAVRGGGFRDDNVSCRSHSRSSLGLDSTRDSVGFRMILVSGPWEPESYILPIVPGFNLIANHFDYGGNTLQEVFPFSPDMIEWSLRKWNALAQAYETAYFDGTTWINEDGTPSTLTLGPGEGGFLSNPGSTTVNLPFGGLRRLSVSPPALVSGWQILSRQVPEPGNYETIVLRPPVEGAIVRRWNLDGSDNYTSSTFTNGVWQPSSPTARVGEAWFLYLP